MATISIVNLLFLPAWGAGGFFHFVDNWQARKDKHNESWKI